MHTHNVSSTNLFESTYSCNLLAINNTVIFKKNLDTNKRKTKNDLERCIYRLLLDRIPIERHRISTYDTKKILEKELRTWNLWKALGISVPELIGHTNEYVLFEYLTQTECYKTILQNNKHPKAFDRFLEVYQKIRQIARNKQDVDILHSDPHLGNFLYSYSEDKSIPIDSGVILNPKLSFDMIDTGLIIRTIRSISELNTEQAEKEKYIRALKQTLSKEDISRILNLNHKLPLLQKVCFIIAEATIYKTRGMDKQKHVPFMLRTYEKAYASYIRPILEE